MARDAGGGKAKRGRLFDDLSVAQVVAGALAAVTSMLLASQIGIYGSVIGVGVGSVVSAVASQLYKKFFTASAEKLRELKPGETGYVPPAKGASDDAEAEGPDPSGWTAARHAAGPAGATATLPQAEKTARLSPQDSIESREAARRSRTPRADDAGLRDDPTVQRARERREHKKKLQRRVVAVSIASAIVAVALSALVIDLVTTGQGVGAKTQPLIPSSSQAQKSDSSGSGDASDEPADKGASSGSNDSSTTDPSKDTAPNGSSGSSGDNSSSGGDQGASGGSGSSGSSGSSGPSGDSSVSSGSSDGSGSGSTGDSSGSGGSGQSGSGSHDSASQPNSGGSPSSSTQSSATQSSGSAAVAVTR